MSSINISIYVYLTVHCLYTGYRCEWCGMTTHAGCRMYLPTECNFGILQPIYLPPHSVSIPRTEVPIEAIIGVQVKSKTSLVRDYSCRKYPTLLYLPPPYSTLPNLLPLQKRNLNFDHRRLSLGPSTDIEPCSSTQPLNHTHPKTHHKLHQLSMLWHILYTIYILRPWKIISQISQHSSALLLLSFSLSLSRKRAKHYRILLQLRFFLTYFHLISFR